jgi:predicted nucleotidyltransferase
MYDIKKLGNQQLGLHYEVVHKKLNDMKRTIIEDITNLWGKSPNIDFNTITDSQKFHTYCSEYISSLQEEKKNALLALFTQEHTIQQEIEKRQKQMLKEIGIHTPSMRTKIIIEKTK